ncbi:DUF2101 family protein [Palaeococcus ferrophilus]|uniref:DUF2101 family protein n=1 Tax=Palaeococcus ferrophilus TaxID=83868 RepID=UPI00064F28F8|nr:DUF2101 family protein [Palaeococcus ferrophilus]
MAVDEFLYSLGELVERSGRDAFEFIHSLIIPRPREKPPRIRIISRLVRKKVTIHELLSLKLQLTFMAYLLVGLATVFAGDSGLFVVVSALYLLYMRSILVQNCNFFIEYEPYRAFYYGLSLIAVLSYGGYILLRRYASGVYYFYGYLVAVFVAVGLFRHVFRSRYGREWTYGVIEEIKGDLVRISTHDDVSANVRPGTYWVEGAEGVEVGAVVKVLVEERPLKGAVPRRVLEVYESSQTSTEPKEETE